MRYIGCLFVVLILTPCAVRAELIRFQFTGQITEDPIDPAGVFPDLTVGELVEGSFQYDTDLPEQFGGLDDVLGFYNVEPPAEVLAFRINDRTFSADMSEPPQIIVANNQADPDIGVSDLFAILGGKAMVSPEVPGLVASEIGIAMLSTDTEVLSSPALPTDFDVSRWEDRSFFFLGRVDDMEFDLAGEITGIQRIIDGTALQAGDADQDLDFDQMDLVQVQIAAKYLSGRDATWGEGDWNAAPGGVPGSPPEGDGVFDQLDVVAALSPNHYLTGPYSAVAPGGSTGDNQTSVGYNANTGEVWVDAPAGKELTSINISSASSIFTGDDAMHLDGAFDNDADDNIFKATFGGSFSSLSFGNVAQAGLAPEALAADLTVVGSLAGGGDLGDVDLIYVPEPTSCVLAILGVFLVMTVLRRGR